MVEQNHLITLNLTLKLPFKTPKLAETVNKATAPENIEAPSTITLSSQVVDKQLIITVKAENNIRDFITTLDDYLEKIDLSLKTVAVLE